MGHQGTTVYPHNTDEVVFPVRFVAAVGEARVRAVLADKVIAEGDGWRELGWANGARVRVEADDARRPGIDDLHFERHGPATELVVAGVPFVSSSLT